VVASPTQISEGQTAVYTVSRSNIDTHYAITISYTMSGGATLGSDYTLSGTPGQVTIPAGQSSGQVTLTALIDHVSEKTQRAIMNLSAAVNYTLQNGSSSATVSISDAP
jgi:hypothetical protein